ncbi:MAG: hypothetical protein U9O85_11825 [Euryarchaeota archaeon]|nr:hypothetical protein [Euryarchaeota archaeon]
MKLSGCNILLDSFQGEVTNAWNELTYYHDVNIFFKGDQCNPLIAAADFITRFIDESLALNRLNLVNGSIEKIMKDCGIEQVQPYYIGHTDVVNIVPAEKKQIPRQNYLKRPSVFLLPEGVLEKEKIWFEESAIYDKVLNFASKLGGGFKRIEQEEDYRYLLQPGNYVIYQGDKGMKNAQYLKDVLEYPIKICSLEEIQK